MTITRIPILALTALLAASEAHAYTWCYDRYSRRRYRCLSTGERIAIGVCVGVGVFLLFALCGLARRRRVRNNNKQFRPPPPVGMGGGGNPYANNPPPPVGTYGNYSGYNGGSEGTGGGYGGPNNLSNLPPPPNSYQPGGGLSGQYYNNERTAATDFKDSPMSRNDNELADHSYEYRQAQENAASNEPAPPGYNVPSGGYAAPAGPPPGKN